VTRVTRACDAITAVSESYLAKSFRTRKITWKCPDRDYAQVPASALAPLGNSETEHGTSSVPRKSSSVLRPLSGIETKRLTVTLDAANR